MSPARERFGGYTAISKQELRGLLHRVSQNGVQDGRAGFRVISFKATSLKDLAASCCGDG